MPNTTTKPNINTGKHEHIKPFVSQLIAQHSIQEPTKELKVFISYSTDDLELVNKLAKEIEPHAEVRYWDKSKEPGEEAWKQIFSWIEQSDTVLAVVTDKTVIRAMSVGQEIGHAKAKSKRIVPLVAEGIPASALGCLSDIVYEPISRENPAPAFERIKNLFTRKKQQSDLAAGQSQDGPGLGGVLALLGIVALVWLIFFRKK